MFACPINFCLYVTWQGTEKISNYENRIGYFEERKTATVQSVLCDNCTTGKAAAKIAHLFSSLKKGKRRPITGHESPEVEYRYSSTLSLTSALDAVGVQRHAPTALHPAKTWYPLYRWLGGPTGPVWTGAEKSRPPTGIRSPDRLARSESLYRLS